MNSLRFSGVTAFKYEEAKDCQWMSRKQLWNYRVGAKIADTTFELNNNPFNYRDGDVVVIRTKGPGSAKLDVALQSAAARADYAEIATSASDAINLMMKSAPINTRYYK